MTKLLRIVFTFFLFTFITCNASARFFRFPSTSHQYFGIIAGASIDKIGKDQIDTTRGAPNGYDQYIANNRYYSGFLYGINSGFEFDIGSNWLISLGLGLYQNLNNTAKGHVNYLCPSTCNFHKLDYIYKVQSTRLMAEFQIAKDYENVIPYIFIGIGPTINFANNYEESIVNAPSLVAGFQSNTTLSFAYQLGIGLACPFNDYRDRLSINYRYVSLGTANFKKRGDPDYTYELDVGKIRAHEIYIGYTHLFNF